MEPLLEQLRQTLAWHEHAPALQRAAFARFALSWDKLLASVPELQNIEDLVRVGLGYETSDGRVRLSEPVRKALLSGNILGQKLAEPDLLTHARFEQAWTQLDGATTPEQLHPSKVIPWLEKMHHRAHAGTHTREQLEHLDLPAPEMYWDLGRALSREQERFEDAALVYRRCWTKFQHDDYAHHYYAWNLDRAAREPDEVEKHYALAIEQRPDNVWWHARLCTFLIHRARFRDAEEAFRRALEHLDPSEVEVQEDARFAHSLHRWLIEAWLNMGEIDRANEVMSLVPRDIIASSNVLRALSARVADAMEATQLGESVYPQAIPPEERWTQPAFLPEEDDGHELETWRPGRVRRVGEADIELVYAEPDEKAESRELQGVELSLHEWNEMARGRAPQSDAFVILAEYSQGVRRIFHWPAKSIEVIGSGPDENLELLRYVHQWLGTSATSSP
ncbi:hypothetical protein MEBOL_003228 [Melittangium boletus DSM 14713]|uniref:Tetratricopeptide repeat protein n=1 Tax=Melittangium boletus DSM 14713 TaxID=1294270 RepID=A0A250IEW0_9BACT|nr:hypothetical protein MEBOL_003228 [Melittangium boletus DSM 14713]